PRWPARFGTKRLAGYVEPRTYPPSAVPSEGDRESLERVIHDAPTATVCHLQGRLNGGVTGDSERCELALVGEQAAGHHARDQPGSVSRSSVDLGDEAGDGGGQGRCGRSGLTGPGDGDHQGPARCTCG